MLTVNVLMGDLATPVLGARVWQRNVLVHSMGRIGWPAE